MGRKPRFIGLVKKAYAGEEFTPNSQVQPSEEIQFSSILDHIPSTQGDGSQEYLLQWTDGERTWIHESDIADADILTLYRQRTRRKQRQSRPKKSTSTSTDQRSASTLKRTRRGT
ncbi:hypothetical protein SARC_03484 [Sphaeroforma arctica JP610]|uniref:Chromo domain-containing protein n=1 Tax=Sphaeroforma arctica JP610 TaxID=667725 RepID=A0A0L0G7S0_9EUKA|nr:hypothetical protein SARC_03484 [Sphaeroforma arctica JP610]KNC84283.1 hypothetical protein SARC_03484 [Sphaeroforma arctica JP610]|eukprot:XP_014158185.1 hypothetical protein SARC_03484 [Sphaeroforma arctica JP610]